MWFSHVYIITLLNDFMFLNDNTVRGNNATLPSQMRQEIQTVRGSEWSKPLHLEVKLKVSTFVWAQLWEVKAAGSRSVNSCNTPFTFIFFSKYICLTCWFVYSMFNHLTACVSWSTQLIFNDARAHVQVYLSHIIMQGIIIVKCVTARLIMQ